MSSVNRTKELPACLFRDEPTRSQSKRPASTQTGSSLRSTGSGVTRGTTTNSDWVFLGFFLAVLAFSTGAVYRTLADALDAPIVHRSYSTGECVRVLHQKPEHLGFSCFLLPEKYQVEWVD